MNRLPLLIFLFCGFSAISQILAPASWSTGASVRDLKAGETTELVFSVRIDPAWYLYSTEFNCDDGPIKTTFTFQPHPSYELVGKVVAVNPVDKHDDIFGCDVRIFKKSAEFRQKVRVLKSPLVLKGMYEYQVCTEATGQCVPGDGEFDFSFIKVSGSVASAQTANEQPVFPA
ncbi:MAG: protein-disulfide reductase DsbD domain-containing protein [Bacteroidota bacterium]